MTKLIKEDIFDYINFNTEVESGQSLAVPNEIFSDFHDLKIGKSAYAYSYYYLSMYLHLYAKYGTEETVDKFTIGNIQRLLGVSATSGAMSSITKKGGILDSLGYTSTSTDYPVSLIRLENIGSEMEVRHYMYSEEKQDGVDSLRGVSRHSPNFTVKHPDKMYWRTPEDKSIDYYNGTINQSDNTHIIPIEMFLHALNIPDIGIKGFYTYCFIVYKNNKRRNKGWTISSELFAIDLGISERTARSLINNLVKYGFITKIANKSAEGKNKPNTLIPTLNPARVVYK